MEQILSIVTLATSSTLHDDLIQFCTLVPIALGALRAAIFYADRQERRELEQKGRQS